MSPKFDFAGETYFKVVSDNPNMNRVLVVPKGMADLVDVFDVPKAPTARPTRPVEVSDGLTF